MPFDIFGSHDYEGRLRDETATVVIECMDVFSEDAMAGLFHHRAKLGFGRDDFGKSPVHTDPPTRLRMSPLDAEWLRLS